jgi:hypothetical protein
MLPNPRLEANYAHQREVEMIPIMTVDGYRPSGWLGLILGTRLWYPFFGAEVRGPPLSRPIECWCWCWCC